MRRGGLAHDNQKEVARNETHCLKTEAKRFHPTQENESYYKIFKDTYHGRTEHHQHVGACPSTFRKRGAVHAQATFFHTKHYSNRK